MGFDDVADLVLLNGEVVTVDEVDTKAEAVAIKMNKIVKVVASGSVDWSCTRKPRPSINAMPGASPRSTSAKR